MHLNIWILFWRKRISVLLFLSTLFLFALWTWAFLDTNKKYNNNNKNNIRTPVYDRNINGLTFNSSDSSSSSSNKHLYFLQKIISHANHVLRLQQNQQTTNLKEERQHSIGRIAVPAAGHIAQNLGNVRFLKPTKTETLQVAEASAQTLSLVARHKKSSVVGESYLFEEERLKILENQKRLRNSFLEDMNNNNNNNNMMDYENALSSAERQTQYTHELQRMGVPVIADIGPDGPSAPKERLVHLDLKGAPPKLSFLKQILPMFKTLGATGLLIEYEDMFPYTGALQALAAKNAYKVDELKDFLETATMHGLSIIPLIQTFGHLEFALKLHGFEHMREVLESPQAICPSQKDTMTFIENMMTQMIEFHIGIGTEPNSSKDSATELSPKFTHIHIGCDEVSRMGECDKCRQRARNEIFLTHVTTMVNFVRTRWPQLSVIIWDDMLRDMKLSELQDSHIGKYVEPMIWVYVSDIYHFIHPHLWDVYSKVFPTVWAASAFKGAFGESLMIPPLQRHLENNIRWLAIIGKEGGRFSKGFKGIALTGWQRYDHFATLCELLPIGLPSLITSLSTVSKGYFSTNPKENDIIRVLECGFYSDSLRSGQPWIELHPNSHHSQLFLTCTYPGSHIYKFALYLLDKLIETQNYLLQVHEKSAWMSDYNVRHNFSAPLRVRELKAQTPKYIDDLTTMSKQAHVVLYEAFDEFTISEFVEQNIYPIIVKLQRQLENGQLLLHRNVWPQRPLPIARELLEMNLIPSDKMTLNQQLQHEDE